MYNNSTTGSDGRLIHGHFEKGSKTKNGKLSVIELSGTWREMGRQYGALMADELRDIYERGVGRLTGAAENAEELALTAAKSSRTIPINSSR